MKLKVEAWLVAAIALATPLSGAEPSRIAPAEAPSSGEVAAPSEPGERLEVSGVVYASDGRTPVVVQDVVLPGP